MCRDLFCCPDCLCRKRYDASIKDLEKKQDAHREVLAKLQHQFQQAQVKAAAKAQVKIIQVMFKFRRQKKRGWRGLFAWVESLLPFWLCFQLTFFHIINSQFLYLMFLSKCSVVQRKTKLDKLQHTPFLVFSLRIWKCQDFVMMDNFERKPTSMYVVNVRSLFQIQARGNVHPRLPITVQILSITLLFLKLSNPAECVAQLILVNLCVVCFVNQFKLESYILVYMHLYNHYTEMLFTDVQCF